MENNKNELKDWAIETVKLYKGIAEDLTSKGKDAFSFYNQSNLHFIEDCKLMIMGINPGAGTEYLKWADKDNVNAEYLLQGNPCFHGKTKEEILSILKDEYDPEKHRYGWALYHRLYDMLSYVKKDNILLDISNFALTNLILFGTLKEKMLPKADYSKCIEQSLKLIDILNPDVILLLGAKCRDEFNKIQKLNSLIDGLVMYTIYKGRIVLAIPHTAYYYSKEEMKLVGKVIGYAFDNNTINTDNIKNLYASEIESFNKRRISKAENPKAIDKTTLNESSNNSFLTFEKVIIDTIPDVHYKQFHQSGYEFTTNHISNGNFLRFMLIDKSKEFVIQIWLNKLEIAKRTIIYKELKSTFGPAIYSANHCVTIYFGKSDGSDIYRYVDNFQQDIDKLSPNVIKIFADKISRVISYTESLLR